MKKFFIVLVALLFTVAANSQTVVSSRLFENTSVTLWSGAITPQYDAGEDPFFWGGAKEVAGGTRPLFGFEVSKYVTPVVGFGLEEGLLINTTGSCTMIDQSNLVGNIKLNLSNWFGKYPGEPRFVEVVFVPGLGWIHDYGNIKHPMHNYWTYNIGTEINFNLGKEKAWQINIKPVAMWANYARNMRLYSQFFQTRLQVGVTYKFGSKTKKSHNFVVCPYDVTRAEYNEAKARIAELEARKPQIDTVTAIKEVPVDREVVKEVALNNVTIYFDKGKSDISERELSHLDFFVQNADKNATLKITGSADSATGSVKRNAELAEQRALAVKKVLVEKYGFDESKISIDTTKDLFGAATRSRVAVVE